MKKGCGELATPFSCSWWRLVVFHRHDVDSLAVLIKLYVAITQCEQCVVTASADVSAGMPLCSALANKDISGSYGFTAELLDATTLSFRVASVAAGALSFLMSHGSVPRSECLIGWDFGFTVSREWFPPNQSTGRRRIVTRMHDNSRLISRIAPKMAREARN